MQRAILVTLLAPGMAAACTFTPPEVALDDPLTDAMPAIDASLDCTQWTPAPTHFTPCEIPPPGPALVLNMAGDYTYDTATRVLRDPAGGVVMHESAALAVAPPATVISTTDLAVASGTRLIATGAPSLVIASWQTLEIAGAIDVSSNPTRIGAGANTALCDANPARAGQDDDGDGGGGGGGGGAFSGGGGDGGEGADGDSNGGGGGRAVTLVDTVAGGCPGASGGAGENGNGLGKGGGGGGAVQLTAQSAITVRASGRLHAGGAGGTSGNCANNGRGHGGGGGGSGGYLGLEAPLVTIAPNAILAANGGGGGEGCDQSLGDPGDDGRLAATAASGGRGVENQGGDGGDGGFAATPTGAPAERRTNRGGGGGGGGVGFILVNATTTATISPDAVISPDLPAR